MSLVKILAFFLILLSICSNSKQKLPDYCKNLIKGCKIYKDKSYAERFIYETFVCDDLNKDFKKSESKITGCRNSNYSVSQIYYKMRKPRIIDLNLNIELIQTFLHTKNLYSFGPYIYEYNVHFKNFKGLDLDSTYNIIDNSIIKFDENH